MLLNIHMVFWQSYIVVLWGVYAFCGFLLGLKNKKNSFGLCNVFNPLGAFVWIDAIVFGLFFFLVSIFCLLLNQWIIFLLIISVFWMIRSLGEVLYWFLEQFAVKHRNPPHTLWPYEWFKGEEVWIVMQIFWQCIAVVGIVTSVVLFSRLKF